MNWKQKKLVWVETEHPLDSLGTITGSSELYNDRFDAKQVYILKERSLPDFIEGLISMSNRLDDVIVDLNIVTGLTLVVSVLCLVPLEIQTIEDDSHASKFLDLLKSENGKHFWLVEDLLSNGDINYLIDHFTNLGLLLKKEGKVFVKGKVLNRVHLV